MTEKQQNELLHFGEMIGDKVTPGTIGGVRVVNIRDFQFEDFKRAAMFLKHIQATELPESYIGLVA